MSCEAEAKATKSASQAIAARSERGDRNAIPVIPEASASCVTSSHPRRRPRKGGTKRSIAGAHRNFQTYGRPTRVKIPDRKSTRLNSSHLVISYAVFCLKQQVGAHTLRWR